MASEKGGIKSFYRQRKKTSTPAGTKKPSATAVAGPSFKKKGTDAIKAAAAASASASIGSGSAQPTYLIPHGSADSDDAEYGPHEEALRQFDMDMRYGPCLGMTRLDRWERAAQLGLQPPAELERLLRGCGGEAPAVNLECLWEGRI